MRCWKCKMEMICIDDSNWKKHKDGCVTREASFICPKCETYLSFEAMDCSECDLDDEIRSDNKG